MWELLKNQISGPQPRAAKSYLGRAQDLIQTSHFTDKKKRLRDRVETRNPGFSFVCDLAAVFLCCHQSFFLSQHHGQSQLCVKYCVSVRGLAHKVDLDLHIPPLHNP